MIVILYHVFIVVAVAILQATSHFIIIMRALQIWRKPHPILFNMAHPFDFPTVLAVHLPIIPSY